MSSRWVFIPSAAAAPDQTISGTFDHTSTSTGAADNDPTMDPSITGLTQILARGSSGLNHLAFVFDTSTNRDSFVSAIPNGSSCVFTHEGTAYTASSIGYTTFRQTARLPGSDFDSWPSSVASSDTYTIEFTT